MSMKRRVQAGFVGLWCLWGMTLQIARAEHALLSAQAPSVTETPIPAQNAISPVDTLQMSVLEKVFWKRHGLMRLTGLFPLDPERPVNDFRQIARVRRRMLSLHQTLGLITVASMAVTVYSGQRALDGHSARLHRASLPFTVGLYATTATLALASPPKLVPSRGGVDTMTFHKLFAAVHLAGMLLTPMLAPEEGLDYTQQARRHQVVGYVTLSAFTAGMLVVTLLIENLQGESECPILSSCGLNGPECTACKSA